MNTSKYGPLSWLLEVYSCCSRCQYLIPLCNWIIFYCMYMKQFVFYFVDGHLGFFTFWPLRILLQWMCMYSIEYLLTISFDNTSSGIRRPCDKSMFIFLRNCQTVCHIGQTISIFPTKIYECSIVYFLAKTFYFFSDYSHVVEVK